MAHYDPLERLMAESGQPRTRELAMLLSLGDGRTLDDWTAEDEFELPPDLRRPGYGDTAQSGS